MGYNLLIVEDHFYALLWLLCRFGPPAIQEVYSRQIVRGPVPAVPGEQKEIGATNINSAVWKMQVIERVHLTVAGGAGRVALLCIGTFDLNSHRQGVPNLYTITTRPLLCYLRSVAQSRWQVVPGNTRNVRGRKIQKSSKMG